MKVGSSPSGDDLIGRKLVVLRPLMAWLEVCSSASDDGLAGSKLVVPRPVMAWLDVSW